MLKLLIVAAALGLAPIISANPLPTPVAAIAPLYTEYVDPNRPTPEYYECDTTTYEPRDPEPSNPTHYVTPLGLAEPTCTLQNQIEPVVPDSTMTIYQTTVTSTAYADCGDCVLVWSTGVLYFFAPIINTATITHADPSTAWELDCRAEQTPT